MTDPGSVEIETRTTSMIPHKCHLFDPVPVVVGFPQGSDVPMESSDIVVVWWIVKNVKETTRKRV